MTRRARARRRASIAAISDRSTGTKSVP